MYIMCCVQYCFAYSLLMRNVCLSAILKEWKQTGLSGPMSVVQLFCLDSTCAPSDQSAGPDQHRDNPPSLPPFHVLACSAVELANVYL